MNKRAAIYVRVSTDMQRDNFSIPSQVSECMKYARSKKYILVGNQFVDSETGRDTEADFPGAVPAFADDYSSRELSRPSLDACLLFLEKQGFDVLIVHALDRLARDPYIRQTLERELNSRGARVEYVLGAYEETAEGEIRKDLDATFAKWENAKRVERSMRGKKMKAASGQWVSGMVTFGYTADPNAKGGITIIPEEAELIRKIFFLYTEENRSIRAIARIMREDGHISHRGNYEWAKTTINNILVNSTYIGYYFFNKTKAIGKKRTLKDPDEWIRIECEPIVSLAVFKKAEARMKHNKVYVRKHPSRAYMLSGMLFCSRCNRPYLAQTSKADKRRRKKETQCYRHRLNAGHCMNKSISAKVLEPIVWAKVLDILLNPASLIEGYKQSLEMQRATQARTLAQIETLEHALHKVKMKRQNLNTAYLDPDIRMSKTEYMDQKVQLDDEAQAVEQDLIMLRAEIKEIPEPASIEALERFAAEILDELGSEQEITLEKKRRLFETMHLKVLIQPDGDVKIDGWFNVPETPGLLSRTSERYALQLRPLRVHA